MNGLKRKAKPANFIELIEHLFYQPGSIRKIIRKQLTTRFIYMEIAEGSLISLPYTEI
jgi:hypothetical protein